MFTKGPLSRYHQTLDNRHSLILFGQTNPYQGFNPLGPGSLKKKDFSIDRSPAFTKPLPSRSACGCVVKNTVFKSFHIYKRAIVGRLVIFE